MRTAFMAVISVILLASCSRDMPDIPAGAKGTGAGDTIRDRSGPGITVEVDSTYKEYDLVISI